MGVSMDITERKQMEEQLRGRLEGYRAAQTEAGKGNIYLREEIGLQIRVRGDRQAAAKP